MREIIGLNFLMLFLIACVHTTTRVSYTPDLFNLSDPIGTIKKTIEQQPTAYAYMPNSLMVDEQCIKLFMSGSGFQAMPVIGSGAVVVGMGESNVSTENICYKNVGEIKLSRIGKDAEKHSQAVKNDGSTVWRVEIYDLAGDYMYYVFSYYRKDAERFIDALAFMVQSKIGK